MRRRIGIVTGISVLFAGSFVSCTSPSKNNNIAIERPARSPDAAIYVSGIV